MTIETVTRFITDDGQEFDSEADAIAHEKKREFHNVLYKNPLTFPNTILENSELRARWVADYINTHRDAILEYFIGEDLPQPHPAPTFGYRDGDSIEPVHPILFRGEVIRQPLKAWLTCTEVALDVVDIYIDRAKTNNSLKSVDAYLKLKTAIREVLLDEVKSNDETSVKSR